MCKIKLFFSLQSTFPLPRFLLCMTHFSDAAVLSSVERLKREFQVKGSKGLWCKQVLLLLAWFCLFSLFDSHFPPLFVSALNLPHPQHCCLVVCLTFAKMLQVSLSLLVRLGWNCSIPKSTTLNMYM